MLKRYNSTERIGINATENIFLREFDWIFREQPIVDVGIDALVEQVENGNPMGKFIALQIKSGRENFNVSKEKITYYISNVHYNYWTNFDLPVALIAHLPEENITYWQHIHVRKIKKTNKRWKLEIPKKNLLNKRAKPHLTKLFSSNYSNSQALKVFQGGDVSDETIFHLDSKIDCFRDAGESTSKTADLINQLTVKINLFGDRLKEHNLRGDSINSPQVSNTVKTFAKDIVIASRRLENEILIFSEVFAEAIYAYEQVIIIYFRLTKQIIDLESSVSNLEFLSSAIDGAILGIQEMREGFDKIPNNYAPLKLAKTSMLDVIDLMVSEYNVSKEMTVNVINQIMEII